MTNFDAAQGLYEFHGLQVPRAWIAPRIGSTLVSFALLPLAMLFFHRFDPARLRSSVDRGSRGWLARIALLFKPLSRAAYRLAAGGSGTSLLSAARHDALMAMTSFPLSIVAVLALAIAALLGKDVLQIAIVAAAILIADISSREKRAGTLALVFSTPRLRNGFVWWKFSAALILSFAMVLIPAARFLSTSLQPALALIVGIIFLSAVATSLGILSSNSKTFIVGFLTFWYVVVNDHGLSAGLDFAGFYGKATPAVTAMYAAIAVVALIAAQVFHSARLRHQF